MEVRTAFLGGGKIIWQRPENGLCVSEEWQEMRPDASRSRAHKDIWSLSGEQ